MEQDKIQYLFKQHITGAATPDEKDQLMTGLRNFDYDEEQLLQMLDAIALSSIADPAYKTEYWKPILQRIIQTKEVPVIQLTDRKIKRFSVRRIAVAASILLVIGIGGYFALFNKQTPTPGTAHLAADVEAPKNIRATITLADGRTISIDSLTTITQGNINISKTSEGKIVYAPEKVSPTGGDLDGAEVFNTLANPRGSKVIDMTLADGSHVWLNAGSSITYPVAFIGNERKVNITGEAYFEISHTVTASGAKQPFIVSANNKADVTVLGTHFNVNAYDDENEIKVTLLEGSVKINNAVIIKPGQQATVTNEIKVSNNIDIDAVMAWKTGFFEFDNSNVTVIMRQLARWYDVSIEYKSTQPNVKLGGRISRNLPLSNVLQLLRENGVNCKQENGKIIVE